MKRRTAFLASMAAVAIFAAGCAATYEGDYAEPYDGSPYGDVGYFYNDLTPYGMWATVEPYGWVWSPLDIPYGWRPYTVGSWRYTSWGWMWMSRDPWGWVPYHYGRWTFDPFYGWIWVPGNTWAPAWVSWRYGDGWIGWAPLPPGATWTVGVGLSWGSRDLDEQIDRYGWCFIRSRDFPTSRERLRVEPASRNVTLLRVTKNVTSYDEVQSVPVDRGLQREMIEREIGRSIPEYRVQESDASLRQKGTVIRGRTIEVYRPQVEIAERLRERIQTKPEERPAPPPRLLQRQERERMRAEQRIEQQRKRLEQEHQRELRQPPGGISAAELRERQEAEQRAQQELERRQRQMMEEREQRLRERVRQRERGRERGR